MAIELHPGIRSLPRWITRTTNVLEGSPQMELAQLKIAQSLLSDDNTPLSHSKFLVHEDDRRRRQQLRNEWFTQWNSLANLRAGGVTWAAEQCKNTSREREDVRLTSVCYWSVIHGGGEWFQTRRVQYLSNGTSWLRRGCSKAVWHVEQICSSREGYIEQDSVTIPTVKNRSGRFLGTVNGHCLVQIRDSDTR